jgi:hypothetical protein
VQPRVRGGTNRAQRVSSSDAAVTDRARSLMAAVSGYLRRAANGIVRSPSSCTAHAHPLRELLLERRERLGISYISVQATRCASSRRSSPSCEGPRASSLGCGRPAYSSVAVSAPRSSWGGRSRRGGCCSRSRTWCWARRLRRGSGRPDLDGGLGDADADEARARRRRARTCRRSATGRHPHHADEEEHHETAGDGARIKSIQRGPRRGEG